MANGKMVLSGALLVFALDGGAAWAGSTGACCYSNGACAQLQEGWVLGVGAW